MSSGTEVIPLSGTRKRTFNLLINKALDIFEQGKVPSVSELAAEAGVSRATAYRYFPTQSDLIAATVDASLKSILTWKPKSNEVAGRITELFDFAYPRMFKHEGALRAALLLSLQQWALERLSPEKMDKKLVRGVNRKETLAKAVEPLKDHIPVEMYNKLLAALSLLYGSEVFLVMKDIWKMDNQQVIDMMQWMAKAVLNQAISESDHSVNGESYPPSCE